MNPIEINNLSKKFRKGEKIYALRDLIPQMVKGIFTSNGKKTSADGLREDEFWVLKDVNFHVKKGEVLGIIGPNGAGKSTILKLMSRLMEPNEGEIHIRGRLSALIELTAGFHPEFTGRENVYFNGAIIGMSRAEINRKYEDIIEFSGIREFIDTPVKRYSSGMSARLGFAIAVHMDPEILLIDEVLSVGDMQFQAKCTAKMREMLNSGTTIILISHNIHLVQQMCERVILLDKGQIIKEGYPEEVIPYYENVISKGTEEHLKQELERSTTRFEVADDSLVEIMDVRLCNKNNEIVDNFLKGDPIHIDVDYKTADKFKELIFSYEIIRSDGILCCSSNTKDDNCPIPCKEGKATINIALDDINLAPGIYFTKISVWDEKMIHPYLIKKQGIFNVVAKGLNHHMKAVILPNTKWKVRSA